jgi:hypothetical protein
VHLVRTSRAHLWGARNPIGRVAQSERWEDRRA